MGSVFLFILWLALIVAGIFALRAIPKAPPKVAAAPVQESSDRGRGRGRDTTFDTSYSSSVSQETSKRDEKARKRKAIILRSSGITAIIVGAALAFSMCFSIVSAKNVGVVVTFGAVDQQTRDSGMNAKLPWSNIVEIDGTIQTDEYEGDYCIPVRIGDGSQACATITNRWSINAEKGATIYEDFRSDDPTQSFRSAVVSTQLAASVQKALKDYNPIAQLKKVEGDELSTELSFAPDYDAVSAIIEKDMKERLSDGDLAQLESITFSYLRLAENTQKKLDDYVAAIGETRIAAQREETAKAQARANATLSGSVSNDPNVLVSKCFDSVAEAIQTGYQLPAGFSCWGGSSAVIVPGASQAVPVE